MIEAIRWLLIVEITALAFLPLSTWLLQSLPDRGFIFSKILSLLLVVYVTWLVGSIMPVAGGVALPVLVILLAAALCWWLLGHPAISRLRSSLGAVVIEETLFLLAFVGWCLMRAYAFDPAITHTEQYMDMALLNSAIHAASYPPYDPWMSGHGVNYYYVGYLMYGALTKLSGNAASVGYNLALSQIFALAVGAAYSLGYALTRKRSWAVLAPLFIVLLGNWHAVFVQIPAGHLPGNTGWWFWDSTRVVSAANDYTINEFPFFSLLLGDLHPHVMALPVTLLALALAVSTLMRDSPLALRANATSLGTLVLAAVIIGSLFTINSWDFPTYLLIFAACTVANAYLLDQSGDWWKLPIRPVGFVAVLSVVAFLPFYLHFSSLAHGIGRVYTHSDPLQFVQIFGLYLSLSALLIGALALLLQPADEDEAPATTGDLARGLATERGSTTPSSVMFAIGVIGFALLGVLSHLWVLLLVLALGAGTVGILQRVTNTDEPNRSDTAVLLFIATACFLIALTEMIYVRDSFDGGPSYRMNTVFKFYYQSWVLLGLAGAYGLYRGWQILKRYFSSVYASIVLGLSAAGITAAATYTVLAPQSSIQPSSSHSLDGMAWLKSARPGDYGAIRWLRSNAGSASVELEAVGDATHPDEYHTEFARIATFSGVPTVMGWEGHELQWRPSNPEIMTRVADVRSIYTATSADLATNLLQKYHVRYVIVGDTERVVYGAHPRGLTKFSRFMHVAYQHDGTTIFAW